MPALDPDDDPFVRHLREAGIRPPRGPRRTGTGQPPRPPRFVIIGAAPLFAVVFLLPAITTRLTDWLWFGEIGFQRIFVTKIVAQWSLALISGAVAFAVLYGNARYALRGLVVGASRVHEPITDISSVPGVMREHAARLMRAFALPWTAILAFFCMLTMGAQWNTVLLALHRTPFGQTDPIFGRDVGYYVFVLPVIEMVVGLAFALVIMSLVLVAIPIHFVRAEVGRDDEPF